MLLSVIDNGDFNGRHGALMAISNICVGLSECNKLAILSENQINRINRVIGVIEQAGLFKGSGSDEIRTGICYFIERISKAGIRLHPETISEWQQELDVDIVNPEQQFGVQHAAVRALEAFSSQYYTCSNSGAWKGIVNTYLNQLEHEFTATRVGSAYALGVLPGIVRLRHVGSLLYC